MPAYTALTDLATVKEMAKITGTSDDAKLGLIISAVSAAISNYCNRNFGSATYTETYNGSGTKFQWLRQRPVSAVASVSIYGTTIPAQGSNPNAYGYSFDLNRLYFAGFFPEGMQNVVVTYTAGYTISSTAVPGLWQAAAEWVVAEYNNLAHIEKGSDSAGQGMSTVYLKDMPWTVRQVVDSYRQVAQEQTLGN